MKAITIRFGDSTFNLIKEEAAQEGVSMSTFVRETTYSRAVLLRARRGVFPEPELVELAAAVRRVVEAESLSRQQQS